MSAQDYRQNYSWSRFSPVDNTGRMRSLFRSAYKNIRFELELYEQIVLTEADSSNLPGLSFRYYGVTDFWRVLLAYNGLQDPIQDVWAGQQFKIPTRNSIVRYLTQQQSNTRQVLRI